jgi:hypothetical protein
MTIHNLVRICAGPQCNRPVYAKGLCKTHGAQARTAGVLTPIRPAIRRGRNAGCAFPDCPRPHSSKGWCSTHYDQQRKGRTMRTPRAKAKPGEYPIACTYANCNGPTHVKGVCLTHYGRGVSQYVRDAILAAQGGACLCGDANPGPDGTWHLDHDHTCDRHGPDTYCLQCLRAMLCRDCNVKLLSWYEAKRACGMAPIEPFETWANRRLIVTGDPWAATVAITFATRSTNPYITDHAPKETP